MVNALAPCTIGIEACSGAHHWARQFQAQGNLTTLPRPWSLDEAAQQIVTLG
jgi:transposase